jgi:hypothetical protein
VPFIETIQSHVTTTGCQSTSQIKLDFMRTSIHSQRYITPTSKRKHLALSV